MLKALRVTKKEIRVSKHSDGLVYFEPRIYAVLPRGRKEHLLSSAPMALEINVFPLMESGVPWIQVRPEDWQKVLLSSPVLSCSLFPCEVTEEIKRQAYERVTSICSCPAVTETKDVHPSYKPEYVEIVDES